MSAVARWPPCVRLSALICVMLCAATVGAVDDLQSQLDKVARRLNSWQSHSRWKNSHHRHVPPSVAEPFVIDPPESPQPRKPQNHHPNQQKVEDLWQQLMVGYQSDQPASSRWEMKQQMSTRQGVNKLRGLGPERAFDRSIPSGTEDDILAEAHEHLSEVYLSSNFSCARPAARLVRVFDVYPSASKTYAPAVVVLNRCSDDTGRCIQEGFTCAASRTQTVTKAFLVYDLNRTIPRRLQFTEDVACGCVPRSGLHQPACSGGAAHAVLNDESGSEEALGRVHGPHYSDRSSAHHKQKRCRCPSEFVARHHSDGRCKCDCTNRAKKCSRMQRGKTYLPERENRCIIQSRCDAPHCTFGSYMKRLSRCPRRRERNRAFLNFMV